MLKRIILPNLDELDLNIHNDGEIYGVQVNGLSLSIWEVSRQLTGSDSETGLGIFSEGKFCIFEYKDRGSLKLEFPYNLNYAADSAATLQAKLYARIKIVEAALENEFPPAEVDTVLNCTMHSLTTEQIADGAFEPEATLRMQVQSHLTFTTPPTADEILRRATVIADRVYESGHRGKVLIGGVPYLMGALENELHARGLTPVYSFSERNSQEVTAPDGTVTKKALFKHITFIEACV